MSLCKQALWALLETVCDPEIPVLNLRELGVLRHVQQDTQGVEVVITPTYSGCPAMAQIASDIIAVFATVGLQVRVVTQLAPAWSSEWITPQAREKLRLYGVAPPVARGALSLNTPAACAHQLPLRQARRPAVSARVACPRCASSQTTEISHFSSTACKALYRCLNCMEPFDYFKPY